MASLNKYSFENLFFANKRKTKQARKLIKDFPVNRRKSLALWTEKKKITLKISNLNNFVKFDTERLFYLFNNFQQLICYFKCSLSY